MLGGWSASRWALLALDDKHCLTHVDIINSEARDIKPSERDSQNRAGMAT